ncbi:MULTISPECIES: hypothetical protein [unclassified Mesorhizobium]|uniref:hypothetical protein n=1 Tax=unclassified Mesorhizobium TaxID=325217 RepID=UPI000FC9E129|nr:MULTISPECIES: hypothetical protein [unclassified Mesorhizobium]RUW72928.1 hypothetical protein EOA31_14355 [Mesorhizobium sp. M4B.F.Ca.ET.049.02.1.2]TGV22610.1 hypothetical protein EN786_29125 [Mesorhizobium sp. M4B.F.Ca.ET.143.01.1.1]
MLAFVVLGCLGGCGYLKEPVAFRAEYATLKLEAERKFPTGSNAAAFETWFAGKSAFRLASNPPVLRQSKAGGQCEVRTMWLRRVEGCINIMAANYCVDEKGKIAEMTFSHSGYC